jgi:cytochrome c556
MVTVFGCILACCPATTTFTVQAQDQSAAATQDVIFARKTLMDFMCDRMTEIEVMVGQGAIDLKAVHRHAEAISAMFMAFPHLFPPGSNLWRRNPGSDPVSETLASPDVWTAFPDFYRQAADSSRLAHDLARADTIEEAKSSARELRIACDACHALYLEEP